MVELRIGEQSKTLTFEEFEEHVRAGRVPPDSEVRFAPVTGAAFQRANDLEFYRSLLDRGAIAWQDAYRNAPPPLLTALVVGAQVRIWWLAQLPNTGDALVFAGTRWTPFILERGEVWRTLTSGVLHISPLHLATNLLWLAFAGQHLERTLGPSAALAIFVASVFGGSLLGIWNAAAHLSLGASGGVFGLIAASVVIGLRYPAVLPERARMLYGLSLVPYMLLMFFSGLSSVQVDNAAHLGGLLTGLLAGAIFDLPGLERRPGWNRRALAATAAFITIGVLVLAALGPRLIPLADLDQLRAEEAATRSRREIIPPDPARTLRVEGPGGWRTGRSLTGDAAWTSPAGHSAWSVSEERVAAGADATTTLFHTWETRVRELGGEITPVSALTPATVGGHPGACGETSVTLPDSPRSVRWCGATRGVFALQAVLETDAADAWHLRHLGDRLFASLRWEDPPGFTAAQAAWTAAPADGERRRAWAEALADIGRVEESLALWKEEVAAAPTSRRAWEGLLLLLARHPDLPDRDAQLSAALAADLGGRVTGAVAEALDAAGQADLARGLLAVAWQRGPGDRSLRSLVARHRLPTTLTPANAASFNVPDDGGTLSLAHAAAAADALRATDDRTRRQLADALSGDDPAAIPALAAFADPNAPPSTEQLAAALRSEPPPRWWAPPLPDPVSLAARVERGP